MPNLFTEQGINWTREANELVSETDKVIRPIFEKWFAAGYSAREISHIMKASITDSEMEICITRQCEDWKKKKETRINGD